MSHVAGREITETGEDMTFSPLKLVTYAFLLTAVRKSSSRQVF